jgi:acyl-CoA synthetase
MLLLGTPSFIRRIPTALRATLFLVPSLRHVILGGEQFPPVSELRQWLVRHTSNVQLTVKHLYQGSANTSNLQIFNIYGITEVSVWATLERVNVPRLLTRKSEQYVPPLGPPMRDTHLAVRTDDNQFVLLAPYLQQRGLKRGTNANNNEESERHVTRDQVLSGQLLIGSQSRICRLNDETEPQEWRETGDLVRVVRGKVYYIGRVQDCLVKVNGKKINLLEISTTLKSCPQVREAMYVTNTALLVENVTNMDSVLAVDDFGLVCFVETNELDAVAAVNHFARQHLPSFMRPNHVLVMETVPITLNGKVDKTALRDMFHARVADQSSHTAVDRNAVSAFVLQHWRSAVSGLEDWSEDQIRAHHLVALGASSIDVFECADKLCARLGA